MSKSTFTITYDGPALQDGSMRIDDLAPSLMAVSRVFKLINAEVNHGAMDTNISVSGTKDGSFRVSLEVFVTSIKDMLANLGVEVSGAASLVTLATAIFTAVRFVRGRRYKVSDAEAGMMEIQITEENGKTASIKIPAKAHDLSQNAPIVDSFIRTFLPLRQEGVDSVKIDNAHDGSSVTVVEDDIGKLLTLGTDSRNVEISLRSYVIECTIVRLSFEKDTKWRLRGGGMEFSASIEDDGFKRLVYNNRKFARGDVLTCEIEQTETLTNGKMTAEHAIKKVQKHTQAQAMNTDLPFSGDESINPEATV